MSSFTTDATAAGNAADAAPAAPSPANGAAGGELVLLLVRHGETAYNASGRIQGHRDIPLSDAGRAQARRLGARLKRLGTFGEEGAASAGFPALPPAAIFTSDLARASETADILRNAAPSLLGGVPLLRSPLLRERSYGEWQGMTLDELRAARAAQPAGADEPPGGETWDEVWERMGAALRQVREGTPADAKGVRAALVVGHGGSLRMLFCRALGIGPDAAHGFRLGNTSLSAIAFSDAPPGDARGGRILLVNDTSHLEPAE